jgi:hypothetical protein
MGALTFRCPVTGTAIDAGFETDPDTLSQLRLFTLRVACPACHGTHAFKVSDACAPPYGAIAHLAAPERATPAALPKG